MMRGIMDSALHNSFIKMSNLELTYQSFISRISEVSKKDVLFKLTKQVILTITAFIIIAFLVVSLEAIFEFSSEARKILFFGFFSSMFATLTLILIYSLINYRAGA